VWLVSTWREAIPAIMRAWNLATPDGEPIPVSAEGVDQLTEDVLGQLVRQWNTQRDLPKATSKG
jgi:hypothetical protein